MTARLGNLPPTRIEKLETFLIERWCLLRIHCEDGTVGTGEAGVHGWPRPTAAMIDEMKSYLVGRDPSTIEHHAQALQRHSHFMGALVGGAISAIDIALWDIKAKRYGVPIYELMGGKTRDRVRCYMHAKGNTLDELVADAVAKQRQGFTAIRFSPFAPDYHLRKSFEEWVSEAERRVGAVHEALQGDADICIELHRQMNPAESIALGQRLQKFHPYFYEDPMLPDSPAMMGDVQARSGLPVATGERFSSIFQFQELLASNGCAYVRPDVCLCMGLTGSKKVAAMAEAHHVKVIPHNPLSPISTAACVQLDACIPNFALQEYTGESAPPKRDMVVQPLVLKDGYLEVPDAPGLGIELNDSALAEEYIEGREFYVGVLGNGQPKALPPVEVDFTGFPEGAPKVLDSKAKWDERSKEYKGTKSVLANLPDELRARLQKVAVDAYRALRVRDYGRVDLRLTETGDIYVLEVNASCYLERSSEFAMSAAASGIDYPKLIERIVELALERYRR